MFMPDSAVATRAVQCQKSRVHMARTAMCVGLECGGARVLGCQQCGREGSVAQSRQQASQKDSSPSRQQTDHAMCARKRERGVCREAMHLA
jgi:hypothetical protein